MWRDPLTSIRLTIMDIPQDGHFQRLRICGAAAWDASSSSASRRAAHRSQGATAIPTQPPSFVLLFSAPAPFPPLPPPQPPPSAASSSPSPPEVPGAGCGCCCCCCCCCCCEGFSGGRLRSSALLLMHSTTYLTGHSMNLARSSASSSATTWCSAEGPPCPQSQGRPRVTRSFAQINKRTSGGIHVVVSTVNVVRPVTCEVSGRGKGPMNGNKGPNGVSGRPHPRRCRGHRLLRDHLGSLWTASSIHYLMHSRPF